jgi:hypothetical protein
MKNLNHVDDVPAEIRTAVLPNDFCHSVLRIFTSSLVFSAIALLLDVFFSLDSPVVCLIALIPNVNKSLHAQDLCSSNIYLNNVSSIAVFLLIILPNSLSYFPARSYLCDLE